MPLTEGIAEVAQRYYEWTDEQTPDVPDDGKSILPETHVQLFYHWHEADGKGNFPGERWKMTLNTDEDLIRRLWDNYYVPYMKGYFASLGKFRLMM